MTHEETSLQTRKSLSMALKRQMELKPLWKITVNDIISDCGLNRKTFYYHFEDIYSLLKWTLEQDAFEVVRQFDLMVDAKDALRFVMDYVESNSHLLNCAYDSMGRDEMKRFLCDFYTHALAGTLVDWFHTSHAPKENQDMMKNLTSMLRVSLPEALKKADAAENSFSIPSSLPNP